MFNTDIVYFFSKNKYNIIEKNGNVKEFYYISRISHRNIVRNCVSGHNRPIRSLFMVFLLQNLKGKLPFGPTGLLAARP